MGSNWIETVSDKAWFTYFRFYGPTEGYFNRTYALLRRSSLRREVRLWHLATF